MSTQIPRDAAGRVIRPKPSQLLADVMDALGPDHLTTRTLIAALIERDRGAGVEPRAVTPAFGWHLPVLADAPNVPFDMQENSLDIEATLSGPFTVLSTSTTNSNQNVTATSMAPLPNTWDNGPTITFTLAAPALVLVTANARLNVQNLASGADLVAAVHVDGVSAPAGEALWIKAWGTAITDYIHDSTTHLLALAAGGHTVELRAAGTGGAAGYRYVNSAVLRAAFIRYTT